MRAWSTGLQKQSAVPSSGAIDCAREHTSAAIETLDPAHKRKERFPRDKRSDTHAMAAMLARDHSKKILK